MAYVKEHFAGSRIDRIDDTDETYERLLAMAEERDLKVARQIGGVWSIGIVDDSRTGGGNPSIAFDLADNLAVAYGGVTFAAWNGMAWAPMVLLDLLVLLVLLRLVVQLELRLDITSTTVHQSH